MITTIELQVQFQDGESAEIKRRNLRFPQTDEERAMKMKHKFYKDESGWFIDLPEFIEKGLGTKGNLAMVLGADTLLDILSEGKSEVVINIDEEYFEGSEHLRMTGTGSDVEALEKVGHPIQVGGYYRAENRNHDLWLCPVTTYVFGGYYPKDIYISVDA